MKNLLLLFVGLVLCLFASNSLAAATVEGFAETYLYEEVDIGLSPTTVSTTVNCNFYPSFAVADFPQACSKARLCLGVEANIYKGENLVTCMLGNPDTAYYWHGGDSKASTCEVFTSRYIQSPVVVPTYNALKNERLCKAEGASYMCKNYLNSKPLFSAGSNLLYWHGGDSKASTCSC